METCSLSDFMKSLTPWLSTDYLRKVVVDKEGHIILLFNDGVKNIYDIDDCNKGQIRAVLDDLKKQGIEVED